MKKISLLIALLSISIFSNPKDQPNFVIIYVDDMGYADIGEFQDEKISTPNLDLMATNGQTWTNFYASSSVCTPSRAGLLTGRLPIRNGMMGKNHGVFFPDSQNGIPTSEITIPEELKKQGYKTAIIGKWHLGHKDEYLPLNHGFDYFFGIPYSNDMNKIESHENVKSNIRYPNYWKQYSFRKRNTSRFCLQQTSYNYNW